MRISFFLFILFIALPAFGQYTQAPKWAVPPRMIDFKGTTPALSNLPNAPTGDYHSTNGMFDPAGNLLFYVVDNQIFDKNSNVIANIKGPTFTSTSSLAGNHMIVPVPLSCSGEYFIIYAENVSGASELYYTRVREQSNGSFAVVPGVIDINFGSSNGFINTFAMSTLRSNNTRILYNGSFDLIQVFVVSNAGITLQSSSPASFNNVPILPVELELHEGNNRLAFSSFNGIPDVNGVQSGHVFLANIFGNGDVMTGLQGVAISGINDTRGVEFTADGNTLAVSGGTAVASSPNRGVFTIDLTQMPLTASQVNNTAPFMESQIELGYDGKMYFVSRVPVINNNTFSNTLAALDLNNNSISTQFITNVGSDDGLNVVTLPIQIDGQNYTFPEIVDLWISDGTLDVGDEPNPQLSSVWEGDIWNCSSNSNCLLSGAENPEYKFNGMNHARVIVQNRGACPSDRANLRLYWTFARTGEIWDDHWLDPQINPSNQINGCPAGGEITADLSANSLPISIPPLNPGASVTLNRDWKPQNPNCYPLNTPGGVFNSSGDPMICLLARIDSDEDPIQGENFGVIKPNIVNSNNIATRNFHLVKLSPCKRQGIGGTISLFNIEDYPHLMNIRISEVNPGGGNPPFLETGDLQLVLNTELWEAWVNAGMEGEGIEVFSEGVIRITDLNNAVLYGVEVGPNQGQPITLVATMPQDYTFEQPMTYSFMLSHTSNTEPTGNSAGVYRFVMSPDCEVQMRSEEVIRPGGCTMIGTFADEEFCAFSWSPEIGLANPYSPRTTACPDVTTTYTLTVISANGCESSSTVEVIVADQSTERLVQQTSPAADQFWLFPNPTEDIINAGFQLMQSEEVQIVIYNQLGQVVSTPYPMSTLAKGYHRIPLSAGDLTPGLYFCELQIGESTSTKQLFITK